VSIFFGQKSNNFKRFRQWIKLAKTLSQIENFDSVTSTSFLVLGYGNMNMYIAHYVSYTTATVLVKGAAETAENETEF
jgi:hypothetical protein